MIDISVKDLVKSFDEDGNLLDGISFDVPFYDPFMIIEKTEGRMAEDDFWIRIER